MHRCSIDDVPIYGTFAVVLACIAVAFDYENLTLWSMVIIMLISCAWPESRSMPFLTTMLAPTVLSETTSTVALVVALGAYGFYFLSLELELMRPPQILQQVKATPNPMSPTSPMSPRRPDGAAV